MKNNSSLGLYSMKNLYLNYNVNESLLLVRYRTPVCDSSVLRFIVMTYFVFGTVEQPEQILISISPKIIDPLMMTTSRSIVKLIEAWADVTMNRASS